MFHLAGRRRRRENVGNERAHLAAVEVAFAAAAQRIEPPIEVALEAIDDKRIEPGEAFLADELIEPVLPFDEEMQAPLAILDIKRQEIFHPGGRMAGGLRLELEGFAVGALVNDAFVQHPGVDDLRDQARERRLRRHPAQAHDQLRAERAHRGELEPHIGLVSKARVARHVGIDLLAPGAQRVGRDRLIERGGNHARHPVAHTRPRAVDDGA